MGKDRARDYDSHARRCRCPATGRRFALRCGRDASLRLNRSSMPESVNQGQEAVAREYWLVTHPSLGLCARRVVVGFRGILSFDGKVS